MLMWIMNVFTLALVKFIHRILLVTDLVIAQASINVNALADILERNVNLALAVGQENSVMYQFVMIDQEVMMQFALVMVFAKM